MLEPNTKKIFRYYNYDEIQSMNFIFGKSPNNNWFSHEELSHIAGIDLLNQTNIENAKAEWINRNFE